MMKSALYPSYIMRTMAKRVFFSTSAAKLEGVSMVQGASRGIGLEFVSIFCYFTVSHFLYIAIFTLWYFLGGL